MKTVRAFIAAPLDGPVFEKIVRLQQELSAALPSVRWVRPETMHLTLAFLGDISEESLEKIGGSMLSIGSVFAPVTVDVGGLGAFPSLKRPRVVWLGLQNANTLCDLQMTITDMLRQLQVSWDDKPFKPHLTLGRCRQPVPAIDQRLAPFMERQCGHLRISRLVLYESQLTARGAIHLPRYETPLTGPSGGRH
ncbi:2'-5' RNA ligase [Syntrophotalea carbinolica DSM 2380]|uniref:RNA 2',3'-cyclic phosphodiesterase n=1 Tax=Syntrophotalea carbinolica (strain DSM 2380 / NBRC 103641 / GraBd1) TaxID=338963 RepID=Q3A1W4_SYNC1|nr:RNA 2',3'-cyclic phosphodiesterase [Syntrophotalea carbinolica]ABA89643.1 2'-5' RNA ligase [Syntrophotalea carbinolica DSM 2380]